MEIDLTALPDDVEALHHLIGDLVAARDNERAEARAEIDRLRQIVKLLQRNRFGQRLFIFLNRSPSRRRNCHTAMCETVTPRAASSSFSPAA